MTPINHFYFPLFAIYMYVNYPRELRMNSSILHKVAIAHNTALVVFSAWVFLSIFQIIYKHGIVFEKNYYFNLPEFEHVMFLFYLSKYYEFFDTFLVYLSGKDPIFLQKYHHIGAVVSWHITYIYKVDCIWIPSFANSFIHTIMYSYYLCCLLKIDQVRKIKKFLTSMQLVQLVGTMLLCNYYYLPPVETYRNYMIICIVNMYNTFLIWLFVKFYVKSYLYKKKQLSN